MTNKVGPKYNAQKRRWYNARGEQLALGHGYLHNGTYVQYNSDGTVTRFTPEQYAKKKLADTRELRKRVEKKYLIPFIEGKKVKLTNAGNASGVVISTNMLDSIAKYGKQVGIPALEAIGLFTQESTLGSHKDRTKGIMYDRPAPDNQWYSERTNYNGWSPIVLSSDWNYFKDNPYVEYLNSTAEITKEEVDRESKHRGRKIDKWEIGRRHFRNQEKNFNYFIPPILHALEYYKSGKYNSKEPDHTFKVRARAKELKNSPEIQEWMKTSKYYYNK